MGQRRYSLKVRRRSGLHNSDRHQFPPRLRGGGIRAADCSYLLNVGNGVIGQVMDATAR